MTVKGWLAITVLFTGAWSGVANAILILQVYSEGATAVDGTLLPEGLTDEDTWLIDGNDSFTLELIAAFGPKVLAITNAFLVTTSSDTALLSDLGNLSASTRYEDSTAFESFLAGIDTDGATLNEHSPYGGADIMVDLFALALDDFANLQTGLKDCNADVAGTTTCVAAPNAEGELRTFGVSGLNLNWAHFDLVALVETEKGRSWAATWDISPGSHDATWVAVPEPTSLSLLGTGLILAGFAARRRRV